MSMDMKPVIPFEPVRGDGKLPSGPDWVAQIKWDGVRMLAYFDGTRTRLWNRRTNERTLQYPEFADARSYCSASSVILDGEMIALESGKPSFHEVMKRDRLRDAAKISQAVGRIPVSYMIFDVLYCNGRWVTSRPLAERQNILQDIVIPGEQVQLVQNVADPESLFQVTRSYGLEGIVCKNLTKTYVVDGKDDRWQKFKHMRDLYAVAGGVTFRSKTVNALLLGLYDDAGTLYYIGHAGTGKVTQAEWAALTERAHALRIPDRPFRNEPERSKDAVWLKPEIVVKVQFLEWTPDGMMRHPSIQAFADTADAVSLCTFGQL